MRLQQEGSQERTCSISQLECSARRIMRYIHSRKIIRTTAIRVGSPKLTSSLKEAPDERLAWGNVLKEAHFTSIT